MVSMSVVANLRRMSRDRALSRLCSIDPRGGAARVPLGFLASYLRFTHTPPERNRTPVTLLHPGRDAWTPVELSTRVLSRAAGPADLVILRECGHFPVEDPGVTELVDAVAGLAMALTAAQLSTRPATDRSTWGMRRAEVIGAALQAGMLAVVGLFVAFKAVHNLLVAPQVEASGMLVMGVIGLAANVIALLVLSGGRGHDGHGENLNMRAALLEVLNDALGSVSVIIAAAVVARTGWTRADAVASLLIAVLILPRAVTLLRSALAVLMDFTPRELDLAQVRSHMLGIDHVEEVHDLHAWTVASGMPVLTAHVVVRNECLRDGHTEEILDRLQNCVAEHFPVRIQHATLQLEPVSHLEHEAAYC